MKIRAKKLKKKSLFKLILASSFIPMGLFFLLCGIASVFGAETVEVNNQPLTGIKGFLAALSMYPFFVLFFSAFIWIGGALGLWMYSWFWKVELEFVDGEILSSPLQNSEVQN